MRRSTFDFCLRGARSSSPTHPVCGGRLCGAASGDVQFSFLSRLLSVPYSSLSFTGPWGVPRVALGDPVSARESALLSLADKSGIGTASALRDLCVSIKILNGSREARRIDEPVPICDHFVHLNRLHTIQFIGPFKGLRSNDGHVTSKLQEVHSC